MIANCYVKREGLGYKAFAVPLADRSSLQMIRREAYVWIQLLHDHILPLEGITDDFGPLPALVSLWMENGTLNDLLKREFFQLTDRRKLELVGGQLSSQFILNSDFRYGRSLLVLVIVRLVVDGCSYGIIY